MTPQIAAIRAVEILNSRARPTLAVTLTTSDGTTVRAGVPSGASTGTREAVELRDGDPARYGGQGVLGAVGHVNGGVAAALTGRTFAELDQLLIDLDGTATKSRLGANAIVGVSMAAARAFAAIAGQPLWRYLTADGVTARLPVPHFNVVNGGVHAPNPLDFQEFMIAPIGALSLAEAVRCGGLRRAASPPRRWWAHHRAGRRRRLRAEHRHTRGRPRRVGGGGPRRRLRPGAGGCRDRS